ncbi:hypothetical protein BKA70DRAFT_1440491 [Coprinopsis sp. MPI-PUGE-AT-0042]|nr:hypothetical protein BKA70DRAFT_1440491 [Coprinopsis sp. MPI-PUGE-AT-0042]
MSNGMTLLRALEGDHRKVQLFRSQNLWNDADRYIDEIEELYSQYQEKDSNKEARESLGNQLVTVIAQHWFGVEFVREDTLDRYLPERPDISQRHRESYLYVKERLLALGKLTAGSLPFDTSLEELMHSVSEHIHMGERIDFVMLEDQLPYEESVRLAKRYERSKALVPPMRSRSNSRGSDEKKAQNRLSGFLCTSKDSLNKLLGISGNSSGKE